MSEGHKSAKDVRREKLEAALKENLKRRRAQVRARKAQPEKKGDQHSPALEPPSSRPAEAKEPN